MTNLVSMLIIGALALVAIAFVVLLALAMAFNMRGGERYRARLAAKVDQLRLGRMLGALGIDTESYVKEMKIPDVYQQMGRCASCQNTGECDDRLEAGSIEAEALDFCNNEQSLQELVRHHPAEETAASR